MTNVVNKKRNGGSFKQSKQENDIYFHPEYAKQMFDYLSPHFITQYYDLIVLDACSGNGVLGQAMSDVLAVEKIKHEVDDLEIKKGVDILGLEKLGMGYEIIICNPPWVPVHYAEQIYHHLNSLLYENGVMFFIINNTFCYQGWERAVKLPYQKYYFLPRWTFKHAGKPLLDCGVMVFHKNNKIPAQAANLRPFIYLDKIK